MLSAAERDIATKDVSRLRGGWPVQDAFHVNFLFLKSIHFIANFIQFQWDFFYTASNVFEISINAVLLLS